MTRHHISAPEQTCSGAPGLCSRVLQSAPELTLCAPLGSGGQGVSQPAPGLLSAPEFSGVTADFAEHNREMFLSGQKVL